MLSQPTRYPLHHLARLPVLTTLLIFLAVGLARAPVAHAATCAPDDGRRQRQWRTARKDRRRELRHDQLYQRLQHDPFQRTPDWPERDD